MSTRLWRVPAPASNESRSRQTSGSTDALVRLTHRGPLPLSGTGLVVARSRVAQLDREGRPGPAPPIPPSSGPVVTRRSISGPILGSPSAAWPRSCRRPSALTPTATTTALEGLDHRREERPGASLVRKRGHSTVWWTLTV